MSADSMAMGSQSTEQPRKRQLFKNKHPWAAKVETTGSSPTTETGNDTFSKSKEAYAREERLKAQAKESEQRRTERVRDNGKNVWPPMKSEVRSPKRRRLSSDDEDERADNDNRNVQRAVHESRHPPDSSANLSSARPSSPITFKTQSVAVEPSPRKLKNEPVIIDMSDDEETELQVEPPIAATASLRTTPLKEHNSRDLPSRVADLAEDEDDIMVVDEDPEYTRMVEETRARQLREQVRQDVLRAQVYRTGDLAGNGTSSTGQDIQNDPTTNSASTTPQPYPPSQPQLDLPSQSLQPSTIIPDPIIHLLVHSPLPNTTPFILKIRLTTKLKMVREAWLAQQEPAALTDADRSEIFLRWRGRRVFNFTTCKSLGIGVSPSGEVMISSGNGRFEAAGADKDMGVDEGWAEEQDYARIQMEAVTQGYLDEKERKEKQAEEEDRQKASLITNGNGARASESQSPSKNQDKGAQLRIILKARGFAEYKLRVRPTTTFGQILRMYKLHHTIDPAATVSLMFDGDKLGEDHEMQSSEVADMDVVEVHIRT